MEEDCSTNRDRREAQSSKLGPSSLYRGCSGRSGVELLMSLFLQPWSLHGAIGQEVKRFHAGSLVVTVQ